MALSSDNLEKVGEHRENWLFELKNNNSTSVYLAYQDYDDGTRLYHGAITKHILISESIDLEAQNATTSGFTLSIVDIEISGVKLSEELYGGSNSYQNQEIIVSIRVSNETIEIGRFRMMNFSFDGHIISIACQSARPWDNVMIPQDRDPSDVLIPLVYGFFRKNDTPSTSSIGKYVSKFQPYLLRPIPLSPNIKQNDLSSLIVGIDDSIARYYIGGYNPSKISGSHSVGNYQMSLYRYDQSLDAFIQLAGNGSFQDGLNGNLEIFDLLVNSRQVFYLIDSDLSSNPKLKLPATFKVKPFSVSKVSGGGNITSDLENSIDLEQDYLSNTPTAEPHDTNQAVIEFPNIDNGVSTSNRSCILEYIMPPFDGELLNQEIKFSIYFTVGISVPDLSMTTANFTVGYKWSTSAQTVNSSGFTNFQSGTVSGVSANSAGESSVFINGVAFTNGTQNTLETASSVTSQHRLYIKLLTFSNQSSAISIGYTAFFKIKDVRLQMTTALETSRPERFLYTSMRGEQSSVTTSDTLSGASNESLNGPDAHRDLLMRFTNMSSSTPIGFTDLRNLRNSNGWILQFNTLTQIPLKSALDLIQREHAFIFRYRQGDISKPQYIFVKNSYSSSEYTTLTKADIADPSMRVTAFSELVTKLIINHLKHPARNDYMRTTESEIPNIRTKLNIDSRENIKTINLETLIPTFSSVNPSYVETSGVTYTGTNPNKSYADYYLNLFGEPKLIIDFSLVNPRYHDLEVGDVLRFDNDNMFPEKPFGLASWSGINFMITDTRKKLGSIKISARQI